MRTLRVVNQVGAQFDRETALLAEAGTIASALSREDLNCARATVCTAGADDGTADSTAYIVDGIPEAPGAAAYHYFDPKTGKPAMRIDHGAMVRGEWLRDPSGGGDSGVGLFLHELLEAMADEIANLFVAGPWTRKGVLYTLRADEVCDPVQGVTGTLTLSDGTVVDYPNYVIPLPYFAGLKGRVDRMGALSAAGDITPEGYQIAAGMTPEKDVFAHVVTGGSMSATVMARKKVPGSRVMRRLEQIASAIGVTDPKQLGWT